MVALHDGVQDANALAGYGGLVLSHSHSPYLSPVLGPEKSLSMVRVPEDSPAITAGPFRSSSPLLVEDNDAVETRSPVGGVSSGFVCGLSSALPSLCSPAEDFGENRDIWKLCLIRYTR
jgi:hypothetical protein